MSALVPFLANWGWSWVRPDWDWVWGDWGLRGRGLGLDNFVKETNLEPTFYHKADVFLQKGGTF